MKLNQDFQSINLLKLIPNKAHSNWEDSFINTLNRTKENQPTALQLASYLINNENDNQKYFQKILSEYKEIVHCKISTNEGLTEIFNQLLKTRQDVLENELSKNPLGQILEPGFRVIFPQPNVKTN